MKKRSSRRRPNKSGKGRVSIEKEFNKITRIPFRVRTALSCTAGSATPVVGEVQFNVASLGDRIQDAGDIFSFFRVARFKSTASVFLAAPSTVPVQPEATGYWAIGFTPLIAADYTVPTSLDQMLDFPEFRFNNSLKGGSISVGPEGLYKTTPTHWYQCGTTGVAEALSAGTLTVLVSLGVAVASYQIQVWVITEGVVEFKEPIDTALIPLSTLRRRVERDEKLLIDRETSELKKEMKIVPEWEAVGENTPSDIPPTPRSVFVEKKVSLAPSGSQMTHSMSLASRYGSHFNK